MLCAASIASADVRQSAGAPPVKTLRGTGSRVLSLSIARTDPIVVTGVFNGQANFIVHLVRGSNTDFVFNEIGAFSGQALVEDGQAGRYRVTVEADGSWTLKFAQSLAPAKTLPGTLNGRGKRVVAVRVRTGFQAVVTGTHHGQSNFIVHVVGYGRQRGFIGYVFNEIGNFNGQYLIDSLPPGTYYVPVDADGSWRLRFSR
jgi:uncharacterized protein YdbL (DUF1318 family)